jgi:sulfur-oxidizing protein SoxX
MAEGNTRAWTTPLTVGALLVAAGCADKSDLPRQLAGADSERGRRTAERFACGACHLIPGIEWPKGRVGGPLAGFADRPLIAGRYPNQPDTLVQWLRDAPSLSPETGMPPTGLSASEARDVAAYLYTLE